MTMKTIIEILGVRRCNYNVVVGGLFAYLFNRIDLDQYMAHLEAKGVGDKEEGRRIKDIARFNGYLLKNCKLFAYAYWVAKENGQRLPKPEEFGVLPKDARILRRLNLSHLPKRFKVFSLEEFDAQIEQVTTCPEMRAYIGRFISKKMKFIMDSYGQERVDIESNLKEAAVSALYKQYPRYESYLHFTNVAKASIHNVGHSFITYMTAKTRQQLLTNADGRNESVHVSLAAITELPSKPSYVHSLRDALASIVSLEHLMGKRCKKFLMCMAGHFDPAFSEFLQADNSEVIESMNYERYKKKLQAHLQLTDAQTGRAFRRLRHYL